MSRIARLFASAFPSVRGSITTDPQHAARRDRIDDSLALDKIVRKSTMTTDAEADAIIARHRATAERAATEGGKSFRDAMTAACDSQAEEIDRLRAIIRDMSAERPRRLISITALTINGSAGARSELIGVAGDGTIWNGGQRGDSWRRIADLPQGADEL
ncbi:hypothetical protein [Acidiphilium sp.]|uniref:hypothetical protein n=1 Tax=Acidiphilium sp. TaxID=527 RepID=UPI003CFF1F82